MSLQTEIKQVIERTYSFFEKLFRREFIRPTVSFQKIGKTIGRAFVDNKIILNPLYLDGYKKELLWEVLRHEAIHCIAHQLYGKLDHGPEWKALMRAIGLTPIVQYDFPLKDTNCWHCNCREFAVSARLHNKMKKGERRLCKNCQGELKEGRAPFTQNQHQN